MTLPPVPLTVVVVRGLLLLLLESPLRLRTFLGVGQCAALRLQEDRSEGRFDVLVGDAVAVGPWHRERHLAHRTPG